MSHHLSVQESHLKELGCANIGDRIIFLEFLKLLKKHKRDADRSRALWSGTTPVCSLAYHRNCVSFCFQVSTSVFLYTYVHVDNHEPLIHSQHNEYHVSISRKCSRINALILFLTVKQVTCVYKSLHGL